MNVRTINVGLDTVDILLSYNHYCCKCKFVSEGPRLVQCLLFVCLELRSLECDQGTIGPAATKTFLPSQGSSPRRPWKVLALAWQVIPPNDPESRVACHLPGQGLHCSEELISFSSRRLLLLMGNPGSRD